jgi:hypothetical protein
MKSSCVAVSVLLAVTAAQAGAPFPGGTVDSSGRTAYVAGVKGVDAIDLATGTARWRSPHAQKPLLIVGDQLYALSLARDGFHVAGLDLVGKGECSFRSGVVHVPRWVIPSGEDGQAFHIEWHREGKELILAWSARTHGRLVKEARGRVCINLATGKTEEAREGSGPPPVLPPKCLERLSVRWHRSLGGQVHAAVEEELEPRDGQRRSRLVLRTWNEKTGKESRPVRLIEGARPTLMRGMDGLHLWVRDAAPAESPQPGWTVYSGLDGDIVGRVPFVGGTQQGLLIGGQAYCLVAKSGRSLTGGATARSYQLVATSVRSGETEWTWPLSRFAADGD